MAEEREVTCDKCKTKFVITPPTPEVANLRNVSIISLAHEELTRCPSCQATYVFVLGGQVSFAWGLQAVPENTAERQKIIVPPSSLLKMRQ
ncbi:MAG: hypothetical protein KGN01_07230 [Patescibacteria group bacterium]|nr:hypothetical protein [Patescibacteria group bacterium]